MDQASEPNSKRFRKVANANLAPNSPKGEIGPLFILFIFIMLVIYCTIGRPSEIILGPFVGIFEFFKN